ncbi:MAG: DUF5763 domain-containing protein [Bacillota bacterium]
MKSSIKSVMHNTFENKNIAIPLYAILGTSAILLVRHFLFNKERKDNFRAGATQFENKQLGTIEQPGNGSDALPDESATIDRNLSFSEAHEILENTLPPEEQLKETSVMESSMLENELPEESIEIPQNSIQESIDEVTAPVSENTAQCKAITKKGNRCRNKADSSGYCFQHRP